MTDYRRAFKIACELLNGDVLYGIDADTIFKIMMNKDGMSSSSSYEEYILSHLQDLDHGQYAIKALEQEPNGIMREGRQKMGMTIDEAERLLNNHLDGVTNYCERELTNNAIEVAIETMRKYQKIEQLIKDIPYGGDVTVRRIQEVIEDEILSR